MPAALLRKLRPFFANLSLVYSLVRRDYALQYAGTALGLVWLLMQYAFQVALFFFIFGFLIDAAARPGPADADYLLYLLGGMALWLPLAEMLLRGCGILAENRQVIRRTTVGARLLLWVPVVEAMLHYLLLFALICGAALLRGATFAAPLQLGAALLLGLAALLFFGGWTFLLARVGIIFKDVSPLMRLLLQIVFWSTPIVYAVPDRLAELFAYHPVHVLVALHRELLFGISAGALPPLNGLALLGVVSLPVFFLSGRNLHELVVDQL